MNEVESTSAGSKKRGISLWPSIVMFALGLGLWVFVYDDFVVLCLWVISFFFSAACLVCFLVLMILRRPKRSLSFLIPIFLYFATGLAPPIPVFGWIMGPIDNLLGGSRNHVEFVIYEARHHIKAEVRQNGYRYKEWQLNGTIFIVYDVTDAVIRKNDIKGGCNGWVSKVDEHFYFWDTDCGFP